jgi:hypothetical protein
MASRRSGSRPGGSRPGRRIWSISGRWMSEFVYFLYLGSYLN